ncbi:amidohydrolase family protein [Novosphingobium resinovorum]|uniref:amidohydrolase family protein n=1 Tax=Novosphingobium resinovorum TaxID=158500 RepID=UPI002ED5A8B9|nr:amidohydrolase family protein [Novosphingobium resinovorum]
MRKPAHLPNTSGRLRIGIASALALALTTLAPAASAETQTSLGGGLSLKPARTLAFDAHEGTWMQPDLSPDGRTILFDLLGDIYALDVAGGTARPVLTGMAFETHPVFSPDGKRFAFVSDRSGVVNLWTANVDGTGLKQLSAETSLNVMSLPAWSPDGKTVYVSRMVHSVLAFELWSFPADGGAGAQITKANVPDWDSRPNALGTAPSPDGKYLYFAAKLGHTWTEKDPPVWSIARREIASGKQETVVEGAGGAMSPALSHDGRTLAYAARIAVEGTSGDVIRLRDLTTGEDRVLGPIDADAQNQGYYYGLTPRFTFAPDDRSLILSVNGKLARMDVSTGTAQDIPFTAPVSLGLGPRTRQAIPEETGPVRVRMMQAPHRSPNGRTLAFTALGGLYLQPVKGGKPKRVAAAGDAVFQPSWSPDGRTLVYVTWTARDGGAVWSIPAGGGTPTRLTSEAGFYTEPVFVDAASIAVLRASHHDRLRAVNEISPDRPTDIVRLPAGGGTPALVLHAGNARQLDAASGRLRFYADGKVQSVNPDGTDRRDELTVLAQVAGQYVGVPLPADEVSLDPAGTHALVRHGFQVSVVDVPARGGKDAPSVLLMDASAPAIRLTREGADTARWSADGSTVEWSVGSTWRMLPLARIDRSAPGASEVRATSLAAQVTVPRDVPTGTVVLRGATALTMRGDETIPNADVVVQGNRILAVGPSGSVRVPRGAAVRDVSGKVIVPGFVDTHAHWFEVRKGVQEAGHWDFQINLAYGVTSGLEVQAFTPDVFVYQDMIDAGMMPGPRAYSVGPGVFRNSPNATEADIAAVLRRYRDHYRTRNIKSYMVGDRATRQAMVAATAEVGMMATTEGASDLDLDLTHFIDGFAGNEHALPVSPLRDDVVRLMAFSGTSYTPTLGVLYGGYPALFDYIVNERPQDDPKVRRFMPPGVLVQKLTNRHWQPAEAQTYQRFAADTLKVQRAGGLVGMGSHGEMQGIGYHWELQMYASGGATPMEVLHAATIGSAEVIGRKDEIGSLEPGKLADLLILDADPRADIRNTRRIGAVMKNGRLYDPATLDEIWPRQRKQPAPWFAEEAKP